MLNVSRITTRQAIETLLENGLIYREQGRGTFVAEPRMRRLEGLTSFTEDMIARGCIPSSRVINQELIQADNEFQKILRIDPEDSVLRLVRVRLADGRPVALQSSYISQKLCPGIEDEDFSSQSLFAILREKYYVYPTWTEVELEAIPASSEEAHLLEIKIRDPVLVVRGKSFTDSFEIIESVRTVYRGRGMALYIGRQRLGPMKR
jgi:GntR family transcriptional regulator